MQDLIIGYGYVGKALSSLLKSKNIAHVVAARSVTPDSTCAINLDLDASINPVSAQRIWYFVPPNKNFPTDQRLENLLSKLTVSTEAKRIVYISTTGVYGNCNGEWVTETRPVNPSTNRSKRRVNAEQQLVNWSKNNQNQYVILRVAGIYGPNRLPLSRLKQRQPMIPESEAPWSNRIHVEDLVNICFKAMSLETENEILNVADNHPSNMAMYFNQVADIAGLPRPPVVTLEDHNGTLSNAMLSYLQESRRIDNRKMLEHLKIKLKYPSLNEGLPAAWAAHGKSN